MAEHEISHSNPDFQQSYTHEDRETGEVVQAPFPAAVFGIHQEFFGVGRIIGNIDDNPVIEVQDCENGQPCYVMGYETWWRYPVPDEIVDGLMDGSLAIDSVAEYRRDSDASYAEMDAQNETFLDDNGIDPDSLT
jgi:hypothetical protein